MVTFVEKAVLLVEDKSSAKIRKINSEITKLFKATEKLNRQKASVQIKAVGAAKAVTDVTRLASVIRRLPTSKSVAVSVKLGSTKAIVNQLNSLRNRKKIRIPVELPGLSKAAKDARDLNTALGNLARRKGITIPIKTPRTGALPGAGGAGAAGQRPPGAVPVRPLQLNTGPLSRVMGNSATRMGYAIEQAIVRGFSEATIQRDVAQSSLSLVGLGETDSARVQTAIRTIDSEQTPFNEGQIRGLFAENIRVTRGNIDEAISLTRAAADLAAFQITQGSSPSQAIDQAFAFAKAGESSAAFTDINGQFDQIKVDEWFKSIRQGIAGGGQEITAQLVRTLTKSLRVAKFGLNERGRAAALVLAEEVGPTAGVGINQAVKQLSGQGQAKFRLERLRELGLLTEGKDVQTGTRVNETTGEIEAVFEARESVPIDGDLLRSDLTTWIQRYLIPALEADGIDTSNPAQLSQAVGDIVGRATSAEVVTATVLRNQEIQDQVDFNLSLDTSKEAINAIVEESLTTSLANAEAGFTNALGAAGESLETVFIPALNKIGGIADKLAAFIVGPDGEGSAGRTGALVAGGALATGATVAGGAALLKGVGLRGSSLALNGSAAQLNVAATALQRAAGAQAAGGLGNGPSKGKTRPSLGPSRTQTGFLALNTALAALEMAGSTPEESAERGRDTNITVENWVDNLTPGLIESLGVTRQSEIDAKTEMSRRIFNATQYGIGQRLAAAPAGDVVSRQLTGDQTDLIGDLGAVLRELATAKVTGTVEQIAELREEKLEITADLIDGGVSAELVNSTVIAQLAETGISVDLMDPGLTSEVEMSPLSEALGGPESPRSGNDLNVLLNDDGPSAMKTAMDEGSAILQQVGAELGPDVGQGILAMSPEIGQVMGNALLGQLADATINVNTTSRAPVPRLDTGSSTPF